MFVAEWEVTVTEYVVKRHGAREWLDCAGRLTTDPREARTSSSPAEAHAWRAETVDDISLWDIVAYAPPCPVCGSASW